MNIKNKLKHLGKVGLIGLVCLGGKAKADALIETVPSDVVCPGQDYKLQVNVDNTGLGGDETKAVEWKLWKPFYENTWDYISGVNVSLSGPNNDGLPVNDIDFFKDKNM